MKRVAAVLDRRERARLALRGERAAARKALREHLHLGRGRRRRPLPATTAALSRNTISAANSRNVTISMPSVWNCLTTGRLPMSRSLRGVAMFAVAVRSCSMIETDASGS